MPPIGVDAEKARIWEEKQRRMNADRQAPEDKVPNMEIYDAARGRDICAKVAAGQNLQAICQDGRFNLGAVMAWLFYDEIEDFTTLYLAARSARLELMMDEVVAIADELTRPVKADAGAPAEKDRLAIAKLRIETRRWLIDKQLKDAAGPDTTQQGRLIPSEILHEGVGA